MFNPLRWLVVLELCKYLNKVSYFERYARSQRSVRAFTSTVMNVRIGRYETTLIRVAREDALNILLFIDRGCVFIVLIISLLYLLMLIIFPIFKGNI